MSTNKNATIASYVESLSYGDLEFLYTRYKRDWAGAKAEIGSFLEKNESIRELLTSASSHKEYNSINDEIRSEVIRFSEKKGVQEKLY